MKLHKLPVPDPQWNRCHDGVEDWSIPPLEWNVESLQYPWSPVSDNRSTRKLITTDKQNARMLSSPAKVKIKLRKQGRLGSLEVAAHQNLILCIHRWIYSFVYSDISRLPSLKTGSCKIHKLNETLLRLYDAELLSLTLYPGSSPPSPGFAPCAILIWSSSAWVK